MFYNKHINFNNSQKTIITFNTFLKIKSINKRKINNKKHSNLGRSNIATNSLQLLPSSCELISSPRAGTGLPEAPGSGENQGLQPPAGTSRQTCE